MKNRSDLPYGLHWFRRDLRITGNQAFLHNYKTHKGRTLGVFVFDKKFLSREDFSHNRFQFFIQTLQELRKELKELGSDLLFLDTGPDIAFEKLFEKTVPKLISWSKDYEPFAKERDARLEKYFHSKGIETFSERDHVLIEPHEIQKSSDPSKPFQVYTPFSNEWRRLFQTQKIQERIEQSLCSPKKESQSIQWKDVLGTDIDREKLLNQYAEENQKKVTVSIPTAGFKRAFEQLKGFKKRAPEYKDRRDIPSVAGTSQLSIYFKNGSLTGAQVISQLNLNEIGEKRNPGEFTFLKELIWREFYYYILFHNPHVEKESFNPKYRKIKWKNNEKWFQAWKDGKTGFPIVDAGMRQLKQTGWMHNRVRMIVASFLTKDLLIDYRWGEQYFMEQLLDGDLAPNNGGWQWAASTGCDPQPYFRVFNPTLQSEKFDPENSYIKKFIPEFGTKEYPKPIVDHAEQREKAIALFK